jgi:hypothetical protein
VGALDQGGEAFGAGGHRAVEVEDAGPALDGQHGLAAANELHPVAAVEPAAFRPGDVGRDAEPLGVALEQLADADLLAALLAMPGRIGPAAIADHGLAGRQRRGRIVGQPLRHVAGQHLLGAQPAHLAIDLLGLRRPQAGEDQVHAAGLQRLERGVHEAVFVLDEHRLGPPEGGQGAARARADEGLHRQEQRIVDHDRVEGLQLHAVEDLADPRQHPDLVARIAGEGVDVVADRGGVGRVVVAGQQDAQRPRLAVGAVSSGAGLATRRETAAAGGAGRGCPSWAGSGHRARRGAILGLGKWAIVATIRSAASPAP